MDPDSQRIKMPERGKEIVRLLLYYDIFDHPLDKQEISLNCRFDREEDPELDKLLRDLEEQGLIYRLNGFFSVRNEARLVEKRERGNEEARRQLSRAYRTSRLIVSFPFVRAVMLSGSISKGYMDKSTDIDFFIITSPERLWLARTMLILYKKLFLFNSYRYFCLNYFIDDRHLEIEDKNFFTATELFTLIPVYGNSIIKHFMESNLWAQQFYKGYPNNPPDHIPEAPKGFFQKILERALSNGIGNRLDKAAMNLTVGYWRNKYKKDESSHSRNGFKLERHVAKYHPRNFQDRVLERYREKISWFESTRGIELK